jgi:hypothetical protein
MKKRLRYAFAAGSLLFTATGQALALDIGGVNIPGGTMFGAGQIYTNLPSAVGDELTGYGKIDSINSVSVANLCTDCELTYTFGGYTATAVDPTTGTLLFNGGTVNIYLGTGSTNDFSTVNPGSSVSDDMAEASNGTLWLTLKGHAVDAAGNTSKTMGTDIGTTAFTGSGKGLLDVDMSGGGVANSAFNTNSVPAAYGGGNADFIIGFSFNGLNPPYADTARGSADMTTAAVPEPETYALMLSGLGLMAYVVRRRRRSA